MVYPALEFNAAFLTKCKLSNFHPDTLRLSNMDIVFILGRIFGPGITRGQLRRIFRQCRSCQNICYVDKRHLHRCNGQVLRSQADGFEIVDALLSSTENAGFSLFDLHRLLTRCSTCERIIQEGFLNLHDCAGASTER